MCLQILEILSLAWVYWTVAMRILTIVTILQRVREQDIPYRTRGRGDTCTALAPSTSPRRGLRKRSNCEPYTGQGVDPLRHLTELNMHVQSELLYRVSRLLRITHMFEYLLYCATFTPQTAI
jgi:hypothetical protein